MDASDVEPSPPSLLSLSSSLTIASECPSHVALQCIATSLISSVGFNSPYLAYVATMLSVYQTSCFFAAPATSHCFLPKF